MSTVLLSHMHSFEMYSYCSIKRAFISQPPGIWTGHMTALINRIWQKWQLCLVWVEPLTGLAAFIASSFGLQPKCWKKTRERSYLNGLVNSQQTHETSWKLSPINPLDDCHPCQYLTAITWQPSSENLPAETSQCKELWELIICCGF